MVTPQITRVLPHSTSVEPDAYGATWFTKRIGRICSGTRPSARRFEFGVAVGVVTTRNVVGHRRQGNWIVGQHRLRRFSSRLLAFECGKCAVETVQSSRL